MIDAADKILFDKFNIIKILKKDLHSAVYLAHHIYLDKKIILKVLNTDTIGEKVIISRFKREAKILAKLNSESVIKVLDFGMFKEYFYISFEYFPSKNLRQIILENELSTEQKEKLVVQLFQGLRIAHLNNIIHRDIKPENILVNDLLELKIGDFGLAEAINDSFATSQYSLVGTPSYMSPEQISGKQLSFKSDLFSAGIVVFELFTSSNPFLGKDINESINLITKFDESKRSLDFSGIPENIEKIISNLLKRNPESRYQSADEVLKNLGITINKKLNLSIVEGRKLKFYKKISFILFFVGITTVSINLIFILFDDSKNVADKNARITTGEIEEKDSSFSTLSNEAEHKLDSVIKNATNNGEKLSGNEFINLKGKNSEEIYIKQNGELFVECLPWAEVYINNEKFETTPIKKNIELLEGNYELKLLHPEYPEFIDSIKILPAEITSFRVNMDTLFGFLNCKVFPWGSIYIDNVYKGETPLLKPIILKAKKYSVEIRNPQFKTIQNIIEITKGDTVNLIQNFNLPLN